MIASKKTMILAATLGLAITASASYGQPADDGGITESDWVVPEGAESPSAAPEVETPPVADGAEKAPETEAEVAPTSEGAPEVKNPAEEDPIGTGSGVVQALKEGKWLAAFGGVLLFLVFLLRWALEAMKVKWADNKPGGFILAFGTSLTMAMGMAFNSGVGFSFSLLIGSLTAAWLAAGQHGHIKDVLDWIRASND